MEERIDELEDAAEAQPAQRPPRHPSGLAEGPGGFPPRLPPGPPPPDSASPSLQVHVRVSGLSVDGKVVTQDDAEKLFREAARKNPATRLAMLSEPDVPHARVVEVMDLARDAGLSSIAISAKFSDDEAPSPR